MLGAALLRLLSEVPNLFKDTAISLLTNRELRLRFPGPAGASGGCVFDDEAAACFFAWARALPFSRPPVAAVAAEPATDERRSAGNPSDLAVEASQAATESVSSLYCWYVPTSAEGSTILWSDLSCSANTEGRQEGEKQLGL